jgi:hypothetical protein
MLVDLFLDDMMDDKADSHRKEQQFVYGKNLFRKPRKKIQQEVSYGNAGRKGEYLSASFLMLKYDLVAVIINQRNQSRHQKKHIGLSGHIRVIILS